MLIKIGDLLINAGKIVDAQFYPKREVLIVRFSVVEKDVPRTRRFKGPTAQRIWNYLCADADDVDTDEMSAS